MLTLFAALALAAPPPEPGDDRTAILYTVRSTLDGMLAGQDMRDRFVPEATFPIVDARNGAPRFEVRSLDQMLARDWKAAAYREPFGIPTVLQDGGYAQVWVPYSFWVDGKKTHCGVDNLTLVRRDGQWLIVQFGFTMDPPSACERLAAPAAAEPGD